MNSDDEAFWDTIVLGSGVSGMVAGSILSGRFEGLARGQSSVLILDEYSQLGGNHTSVDIGNYTFDIGSFFFTENGGLLKHFPELLPLYENKVPGSYSIARITPCLNIGRYPVDLKLDVWRRGPLMQLRYVSSALYGRLAYNENSNAEDYVRYWIGNAFFEASGLKHYMKRLFGQEPSQIESEFCHKRMRWVKNNAQFGQIFRSLLDRRRSAAPDTPVRQFVRPRKGFQHLYREVEEALRTYGVEFQLNAKFDKITGSSEEGFELRLVDGKTLRCRQLISTIPLSRSLYLCGFEVPAGLCTVNLLTFFVSFSGSRGFKNNVLYNFSTSADWKRLTMHSDFYGLVNGREYFSVECCVSNISEQPERHFEEFKSLSKKVGIFDGDLKLEGFRMTENAYPVNVKGASAAASMAIGRLRETGILSFGRQGGFDYQPTSGVSTLAVERNLSSAE